MQGELDYDSQRLLVASAPADAGEPKVSVGLTEAAAMVEASGFICAISGQTVAAAPTAPKEAVAM